MKEIEIRIAAFLASKSLKTRSNVPFTIESYQKDGNGNVTALVGTVSVVVKEGEETIDAPMLWTSNGNAMAQNAVQYDLVEELPVAELGK